MVAGGFVRMQELVGTMSRPLLDGVTMQEPGISRVLSMEALTYADPVRATFEPVAAAG